MKSSLLILACTIATLLHGQTPKPRIFWEKYDGDDFIDTPLCILVDQRDNVLVAGTRQEKYNSNPQVESVLDIFITKFSAQNGKILWKTQYESPVRGENYPTSIFELIDGNILLVGVTQSSKGTKSLLINKYQSHSGKLLNSRTLDIGQKVAELDHIVQTQIGPGGNLTLALSLFELKEYAFHELLVRINPETGKILWKTQLEEAAGSPSIHGLALDSIGDAIICVDLTDNKDLNKPAWITQKYSGKTGELIWEKSYNSPYTGRSFETPFAVVVDGENNVIVTGQTFPSKKVGYGYKPHTIKYLGESGAEIWSVTAPEGGDFAAGITVLADDQDDIYLVANPRTVTKYAKETGKLLWSRYLGPNGIENPFAAVFDYEGDLVVGGDYGNDAGTMKLSATDGTVLWSKIFGKNGQDYFVGLAAGKEATYITASSRIRHSPADVYVAKYADPKP